MRGLQAGKPEPAGHEMIGYQNARPHCFASFASTVAEILYRPKISRGDKEPLSICQRYANTGSARDRQGEEGNAEYTSWVLSSDSFTGEACEGTLRCSGCSSEAC